ncbi:unnamed protein product [Choristocarpus tenellus]
MLDKYGVRHEHTVPGAPQYNGVAERRIALVWEKSLVLRYGARLEKDGTLWAEVMSHSNDLTNMAPTPANIDGVTPWELWHELPADVTQIPIWGSCGYARIDNRPTKSSPRAELCFMMGVAPLNKYPSHTYRILLSRTGRHVMRRDITMWDSNLHDDTRHQSSGLPLWRGEEFFPVIGRGLRELLGIC